MVAIFVAILFVNGFLYRPINPTVIGIKEMINTIKKLIYSLNKPDIEIVKK